MWFITWQSYLEWRATSFFKSQAEADKHAAMYLRDKDYNKHIRIRFIALEDLEQ